MKNAIITLLMVGTLISLASAQRSEGHSWIEYYTQPDKVAHGLAGYGVGATVTAGYAALHPDKPLFESICLGTMSGFAIGGLKEIVFDHYGGLGQPDAGDFYSTLMGSVIGSVTTAAVIRWSRKRAARKNKIEARDFVTGDLVEVK